jgi:hypothetical protein
VKLTPLGALSLTSRRAIQGSAIAMAFQEVCPTCSGMVEVLVDELRNEKVSIALQDCSESV